MNRMMRCLTGAFVAALLLCALPVPAQMEFESGDRIAIVGNALPDRMQHDGWLESYLNGAYPDKKLAIRNLGFSGDEVAHRPREENFMSADDYLSHVKADVIFAFFGYNESFDHDPESFKAELTQFIEETRAKQYNGKSAPRIVLFSPIAFEDLHTPNLPDGKENNLWLSIYTDAMARVAQAKGVTFVDLFAPSKQLYETSEGPFTINGVHLNSEGNNAIARVIVEALAGNVPDRPYDAIRSAVLEKNWCWFNRYRATDGNDVWGSRAPLEFVDKQTNKEVLQHELVMLDVMTENRDVVIWNAVQGEDTKPDDSNVPDPIAVKTNYQPSEKNGALAYTKPEDGVKTLTLQDGLEANLFASEAMFPELVNPVQMDVDTKGRLWVAAWQTYPKWQPDKEMLDRLLILPDEDRDGVADKAITFAYVHNPTAFTFWNGGVIVASAPNFWYLKDTDGDDVADLREIWLSGLDSADTHHSANGFDYGPDGYIYYQRGIFNVSNVETPWQAPQLSGTSAMYRFNPRTHRFSIHAENPPNPHGGDFDYWGYHFATDATGGNAFQVRMDEEGGFKMHELLKKTVRPVPSSGILSSTHFPEKSNGNYLILNAIGFLGIKQYTLQNTDGVVWGTETDDLLVSSDGNFRPSDFKFGDDGALYVADWANALIGHMQHNVRDPSRDHEHGRVYRVTVKGRPLEAHVEIDGQPIEALLEVLKHPTNGVRLRARIELSERKSDEVIAAVQQWIKQFDGGKREDAHHLLEALWLHQQFNVVNEGLLTVLLNSPEPHAKRAAGRVQRIWEIEGQLNAPAVAMAGHGGGHHGAKPSALHDSLAQEPSPPPAMVDGVYVVHIQTLKEQMRYDRTQFAVTPGMKVRLIFKNPDWMDHNLILVQPGAASDVATAALMLGAEGIAKQWTPESGQIIFASKVLPVGGSQTIEFDAPAEKGAYPYICTYPGHWMLMNGIMHVVDDMEVWAKANPDTSSRITIGREVVQEWTVADLSPDLGKLTEDRSMEHGKEVFAAATCIACHKAGVEGGVIGPDLAGVATRLDAAAMLMELLEPSKVIKEEYKPWYIELKSFEDITGQIVEQTDDFVRVVQDPLKDAEGVKISRKDIARMSTSDLSSMPAGLLNTFTREEILDLMAYLRAIEAKGP
ncbi:MAG: c-type cytochrome [Candidatus Hydrogenedentes bacterium]|nr:c-type cytochrome [Candidatus Hydrogenedentota bacterium]